MSWYRTSKMHQIHHSVVNVLLYQTDFFFPLHVFIFMQWNTFHFIVKVLSELWKADPVRQTGNFMLKRWYTCNRQWKSSAEGPNFVFRKRKVESKSTFLNESSGLIDLEHSLHPTLVVLSRGIVVMWLICVGGEMRLLAPHIQLCVGLCTCYVQIFFFEYNTAMLTPNQWIWLLLVNLRPPWPFCAPATKLSPQTILTGHGWAGRGGCALVASQHGRLEVRMTAGVLDQVVASHEALIAQGAQEALFPRVGAGVARELIWAGKLLLTVGPAAREGPLTCSTGAKKKRLPPYCLPF